MRSRSSLAASRSAAAFFGLGSLVPRSSTSSIACISPIPPPPAARGGAPGEPLEPGAELPPPRGAPGRHVFPLHHLERRVHGGHADGVAPERRDRLALPGRGDLVAGDRRADREAAGHRLGHHHDVRLHAPVLDAEPLLAGPATPALPLAANE